MIDQEDEKQDKASAFSRAIGAKATRKIKALQQSDSVWFGLGMTGLIGWSVSIPTLLGAGLGIWLDAHYPATHSWTLTLLVTGLAVGCLNAWHWIAMEQSAIQNEESAQ